MSVVHSSGPSIADVVRDLHDVPARVLPYAAATALTKGAKRGQQSVIAQMRTSFRNPTPYTLNSTRIEIATKDKLSARIAVKDQRTGKGTRPESYLFPEVEGGGRNQKGIERLLRFKGILRSGEWAYPQSSSILDVNGNLSVPKVKSILAQLAKTGSPYFVGVAGKTHTRALWERGPHAGGRSGKNQKRGIRAIFVFSRQAPHYTPRLDFVGAADRAVRADFASDFYAAAQSLRRKFA
jgi:hypothetical protein